MQLADSTHQIASESNFSGVVHVTDGETRFSQGYGLAHRGFGVANQVDTQFAIASGGKSFTALAVVALIVAQLFTAGWMEEFFRPAAESGEAPGFPTGRALVHAAFGAAFPDAARFLGTTAGGAAPVSKVSEAAVPPKGSSMWVCGSMPPGIT